MTMAIIPSAARDLLFNSKGSLSAKPAAAVPIHVHSRSLTAKFSAPRYPERRRRICFSTARKVFQLNPQPLFSFMFIHVY
jgi:hypothetical protein